MYVTYETLTKYSTCTALSALCDLYPCPKEKPICKHNISADKQCLYDGYPFRSDHYIKCSTLIQSIISTLFDDTLDPTAITNCSKKLVEITFKLFALLSTIF